VPDHAVLVLASASPRRKQLLGLGNWAFTVVVPDVDESLQAAESPKEYVLRLAREKALAVTGQAGADHIVIAADTAVIDGPEILGKPRDKEDAERMLRQLRGRTHQVYTGLAVLRVRDGKMFVELCVTDVPMRSYSNEEISAYIGTGDPLDKAGAYAIQHPQFHPVESMHGCYASVMGLPMCHVLRTLQKFDVQPQADVPAACQSLLSYECPVSRSILRGETAG
jgi:septum formation protein